MHEHAATLAGAEDIAFQDIFRQHYPLVYGIARRTLGTAEEAEEVAQEAFVKLYRQWPMLSIRTSLNAWLARVTLNLAFNQLRARRQNGRLRAKLERVSQPAFPSAEELSGVNEERRLVAEALLALRPKDRACLIARHSGLSYQEVADTVGIRTTSVGKILARAEAKFRVAYEHITEGDAK